MKLTITLTSVAVATLTLLSAEAQAQYVKGNEAVKVTAAGKKVETPPIQGRAGKLCRAIDPCHAGSWHMVETDRGLVECTEPFARDGTCRTSTYGAQKLSRLWIVKTKSTWQWCQFPDLGSKCVDMFARPPANLPYDAVQ